MGWPACLQAKILLRLFTSKDIAPAMQSLYSFILPTSLVSPSQSHLDPIPQDMHPLPVKPGVICTRGICGHCPVKQRKEVRYPRLLAAPFVVRACVGQGRTCTLGHVLLSVHCLRHFGRKGQYHVGFALQCRDQQASP